MQVKGKSPIPRYIATSEDLIGTYCRTGSAADFEQIVRRYAPIVFGECRRVTRNAQDAEDASQMTFLALAMELKLGKTIHYPSAWLQRVARHQAIKIVRSRGRRQKRENAVRKADLELPNEIALDAPHNSGVIRDEIDHLSDRYRLPLVLHYFGGMSLEMIANELKIGRQTVGTRLHRARKMLATKLSSHGIQLDTTLVASALAVIVPAAVVQSIVQAATFSTPRASFFGFPSVVSHLVQASAIRGFSKGVRVAMITLAVTACGTAVGNLTLQDLAKLPKLQGTRLIDWLVRWVSSELKPAINNRLPTMSRHPFSSSAASSNAAFAQLNQHGSTAGQFTLSNSLSVEDDRPPAEAFPVASSLGTGMRLSSPVEPTSIISDVDRAMWSGLFKSSFKTMAISTAFEAFPGATSGFESPQITEASPVPEPTTAGAIAIAAALLTRRRRLQDVG